VIFSPVYHGGMSQIDAAQLSAYSRARLARDARFDGLFFIAVRSTGIYCRPICPAPTAIERNVSYYRHAAAASAAGFRPCLRCRPELAPGLAPCDAGARSFELAWQRVRDGALDQASLAELADEIGVSDRQLRRQFIQQLGCPPLKVHLTQRLLLAKQLLTETRLPITEIAYASGYRSLRRFNQAFLEGCGMPPTRLRAGASNTDEGSLCLRLVYRPPYDLDTTLQFLAQRALPGLESVSGARYSRLIGPADAPGWIHVEPDGSKNTLRLLIEAPRLPALPDLIRRLRRVFDLDAQPQQIAEALGSDPALSRSVAAHPGLRVVGAFDGFETAVRAVLGQQISVAAARTLCIRLLERWGRPVSMPNGDGARLFPPAAALAMADLRDIGLPGRRAATLNALAQAVCEARIDLEHVQPLANLVERLCALPGIGAWTAHYIAMRCLHHPDAFPAGDLIIRQQLGDAEPLSTRAAELRAEGWRPWRSYAVMHLWRMATRD